MGSRLSMLSRSSSLTSVEMPSHSGLGNSSGIRCTASAAALGLEPRKGSRPQSSTYVTTPMLQTSAELV